MYKLYSTGQEFLGENLNIIRGDPLGTTFFEGNANMINRCDGSSYALRVDADGETLLAIRVVNYPLVVYGSERCVSELARVIADNKLQFGRVVGFYELANSFLINYEQIVGGTHRVNLSMDIMFCEKVNSCDTTDVEKATANDIDEITQLVVDFNVEAMGEKPTWGEIFDKITQKIHSYVLLRKDGKIVSIGSYNDGTSGLHRISNVYTVPKHRNKGYSRKVVTYLTEQALKGGNLPCLHVDQHNPVSNHLYLSIGYTYGKSRYEMIYNPTENN